MADSKSVKTGLDVLVEKNFAPLAGANVGLLANHASIDSQFRHAVDLLHESDACTVTRIYAPEHGFRGELQDMEKVETGLDQKTGIAITSLYGDTEESLSPARSMLGDIDVLVVDLQDVGARYYTYVQTMMTCMKGCARAGKKVLVLDRPNPIGGLEVEGAVLVEKYRSFCGHASVANRHGLTIGEYAMLLNQGFGEDGCAVEAIGCDLEVIKMKNWYREMLYSDTGLPWVFPSPNMPHLDTAIVYPGMCLFEATNLSEGRGTTRPFELLGAPFIDGQAWAEETMQCGVTLEGAALRPTTFIPKFQKWGGKVCHGLQIHVTDPQTFQSLRWALALIVAAKKLNPDTFEWRRDAYEFVKDIPAIDLLYGTVDFRKCVETKGDLSGILNDMQTFETWYRAARKEFLLYPKTAAGSS